MFNKGLRQQITDLQLALQQAATYQDTSPFECPLCGDVDPVSQIPYHYCALHLQIANLEQELQQAKDDSVRLNNGFMNIVNIHREAIQQFMTTLDKLPVDVNKKWIENTLALISTMESESLGVARKMSVGPIWMNKITYKD